MKKIVLLAIKPYYAKKIKCAEKTVELRKVVPRVSKGDIVVLYETLPVQKVTAYCKVVEVISMPPFQLWEQAAEKECVSQEVFNQYFEGCEIANGLVLEGVVALKKEKGIQEFRQGKHVPQSYCYLSESEFEEILR